MITPREWESIYQAIRREQSPWELVQSEVIDRDEAAQVIYLHEFGAEPIPMVTHDYALHTYKNGSPAHVHAHHHLPEIGDLVLVAQIGGSRRLPRCLGIVQQKAPWRQPSEMEIITAEAEPWHLVGAGGQPAFQNSWVNYGAEYEVAGFRKEGSRVFLQGMIKNGTVGSVAFTLPAGYHPAATHKFPCPAFGAYGQIRVEADGDVIPEVGNNGYFSLSEVNFGV